MSEKERGGHGLGEFKEKYDPDERIRQLRKELDESQKKLDEYKVEHGRISLFMEDVRAACTPIKPAPKQYKPSTRKAKDRTACAMVAHSTDGHHGANQPASEIEGFNEFSPKINVGRQMAFMNAVIRSTGRKRESFPINELVHIVTGDMIAGAIHDELNITNEWPAPVAAVEAGKLLASQIAVAAPHFEKVTVHFVVADNHGRMTKKPQAKEEGLNSLNYVVGEVAAAYVRDHENVQFNIYPMHEKVISVLGMQYLIMHGHGIRGWAGVPWYGVERKVGKEALARLAIIMDQREVAFEEATKKIGFHKMIFGHFHQPFNCEMFACTGSPQGTDAYDHKCGRHAKPSQSSWVVHPKHGEFDRTNWRLDR